MTDIWPAVHRERDALIHDLASIDPEQWGTPSLCPGWDVLDVLAHLVDDAKTTRLGFVRRLLAARFDFDRVNAVGVARERAAGPARALAEFQAVRHRTTSAPAPAATRLVEQIVHGEDIRRPLGIAHDYPAAEVEVALRFQARTGVSMGGGRERLAGLRVQATDTGFDEGSGKLVRGPAIALLLAASGRPVRHGELTGPGAAALIEAR
jgi:uncharacterized protein (TIGR03083 family)